MPATPEYAEQVIGMMTDAAQANLQTPDRRGVTVTLHSKAGDEVLVAGDLHGHRANFQAICRVAALDENPGRHLVMQEVLHGGPAYENGGCQSHQLLEDIARLKLKYPERFHFILGNHELAELMAYPIMKGGQLLNFIFRLGLDAAYGEHSRQVEEAYHTFIRSLPVAIRTPQKVFISHSLPENDRLRAFSPTCLTRDLDPADIGRGGAIFDLVWGRDFSQRNAEQFAKLVDARILIHGHEPSETGYSVPNDLQIIVDCSDRPACYLTFPLKGPVVQQDLIDCIQKL